MSVDLRMLSIRQPWCDAVVYGYKTVENRSHGFTRKYTGLVGLHASLGWSERGASDQRITARFEPHTSHGPLYAEDFERGLVLGTAQLVDVHDDAGCCRPWGESEYVDSDGRRRSGLVHLVLEDARPLPEPIPCKGKLGLWYPTREVEALIQHFLTPGIVRERA